MKRPATRARGLGRHLAAIACLAFAAALALAACRHASLEAALLALASFCS